MNKTQIKEIQSLKKAKFRKLKGLFFIEGIRLVLAGIKWSSSLKEIFCTKEFYHSEKSLPLHTSIDKKQVKLLSEMEMKKICSTKSPYGIAATCMIPKQNVVDLDESEWLYLDRISDPGNLGSILRSASWFGFKNIALSPKSVDPYNSKTVRSAMGAHFAVNLYKEVELDQFSETHHIIGAHTNGIDITKYDFPKKSVLVFGNEAHGISDGNKKKVKEFIKIKKRGVGESLNIATAASIVMHMIKRN